MNRDDDGGEETDTPMSLESTVLIEKEVIAPGEYWYEDQKTGLPRRLTVTPKETRYWCDQGQAMLSAGLQVPVPYEHDFTAHPMTPKDKILNNAGEVREYRLKDFNDPQRGLVKDALFSVVEVQDEAVKGKIGTSVRWTSPWFNSFTDGTGKKWDNVIAHLALTTRPRIVKQQPFKSAQAALSLASEVKIDLERGTGVPPEGFCLSKAGLLSRRKKSKRVEPRYPVAFSLYSGAALGDEFPPKKSKPKGPPKPGADGKPGAPDMDADDDGFEDAAGTPDNGDSSNDGTIDLAPYGDPKGDVQIEEVLCDLLRALGINCEHSGDEATFKRALYTGAMQAIHDATAKAKDPNAPQPGKITAQQPKPAQPGQPNPMVQQEQQPMYMSTTMSTLSLEQISQITDPTTRDIMLSMYNDNVRVQAEREADRKKLDAINQKTLRTAGAARAQRVAKLSMVSPKIKADLDAMVALPSMALSMGDDGDVVDPMAGMLGVLEKGLAGIPALLTTPSTALVQHDQPSDGVALSAEDEAKMVEDYVRMMGGVPEKKAS